MQDENVQTIQVEDTPYLLPLWMGGAVHDKLFTVDTAADVTVIPESVYKREHFKNTLEKSTKILRGPTKHVCGFPQATCTEQRKRHPLIEYVVNCKDLHAPLLGRPAIEKFNIVLFIGHLNSH